MTIKEIAELLDARLLCGEDKADLEIEVAFASDLMSDVLTLIDDNVLLITGLTNTQVLRTAEMSNIQCIIFARNKVVGEDLIALARENEIAIISCKYSVFKTCGILYGAGVKAIF